MLAWISNTMRVQAIKESGEMIEKMSAELSGVNKRLDSICSTQAVIDLRLEKLEILMARLLEMMEHQAADVAFEDSFATAAPVNFIVQPDGVIAFSDSADDI
jgi:hypothetical protein